MLMLNSGACRDPTQASEVVAEESRRRQRAERVNDVLRLDRAQTALHLHQNIVENKSKRHSWAETLFILQKRTLLPRHSRKDEFAAMARLDGFSIFGGIVFVTVSE